MLNPKELLFAKICLEQGYLEKEDLEKCLSYRKKQPQNLAIDELLIQLNFMTLDQLKRAKKILRSRIRSKATHTKEDLEDSIFGQMALKQKFISKDQLQWALREQKKYEKMGFFKRLGEILVEAQILDPRQVEAILEHQRKRILICPQCHAQYNVKNARTNQKYQCKRCQKILIVPPEIYSVKVESSIINEEPRTLSDSTDHFPEDKDGSTMFVHPSDLASKSRFAETDPQGQSPATPQPVQDDSPLESQLQSDFDIQFDSQFDSHSATPPPESSRSSSIRKSSISKSLQEETGHFGRYEILNKIARGGMGVVYKARDRSLDRIVALKTLIAGEHASRETIQRFLVEAKSAAKLRHPNIVAIHEVGNIEGNYFFTMDYIEGEPFKDVIQRGQLTTERALEIMAKVGDAIDFAHSRGIIHRDLKPSNVIIDQNGEPQVMDFGLAKEVDSQTELTQTGATIGTPSYMPPEQASGYTDQVDKVSDVYSLGSILYEALTFEKPFDGPTSMSIIYKVITEEPTPPRKINPQIPKELETIVLKSMEKEKDRRYDTARDFSDDIRRYIQGEPILARPAGTFYKIWKKVRKNKIAVATAAGFLVLTLILGGFFFRQYQKEKVVQRKIQAEATLKEGKGEFKQGKLLRAQKLLQKALELNPRLVEAHLYLARIYRKTKEFEEARKILQKAIDIEDSYAPAYAERGKIAENQEKWNRALKWYSQAIEKDSSYIEAYESRAKIYEKLKMMDKALADYKTIQKLRAKLVTADLKKARQLLKKDSVIEAMYHLNRAIDWSRDRAEAFLLRAEAYRILNEGEKALEDISRAIELEPDKTEYLFQRAEIHSHFQNLNLAIHDYKRILNQKPQRVKARIRLGWIYYRQGRYLYSLNQFKKAQKKGASSFHFHLGLASLYLKLRRYEQSEKYCNLALDQKPEDIRILKLQGNLAFAREKYEKSISLLRSVYNRTEDPQIALQIGRAWIELKEYQRALTVLKDLPYQAPELHYEIARIHFREKKYSRALREINLALEGSSVPQSLYYELRGDIQFELEGYKRAFDNYVVALDTDWRNFDCFYKILYTAMAGFLWEEAIGRLRKNDEWITSVLRRQWSYEASLFHPEEQQLLENYQNAGKDRGHSPTSTFSAKGVEDAISSLKSGVTEIEKIAEKYLLRMGRRALGRLKSALEEVNARRERNLIQAIIDKIQNSTAREDREKILGYLVRTYVNRDLVARRKLYEMEERKYPLLKTILEDQALPPLLRLYAAKELYDTTNTQRNNYLYNQIALHNTTSLLAALALTEAYQTNRLIRKELLRGLQSSNPSLKALTLSRIRLDSHFADQVRKIMVNTDDIRIQLLSAGKLFLFDSKDKEALEILVDNLKWEEPNIRIYICQTLSRSRNEKVLPYIRQLLKDTDPEVRLAAVIGLRVFPAEKVAKDLKKSLNDSDIEVRLHTLNILDRMGRSEEVSDTVIKIIGNPKNDFYLRLLGFMTLRGVDTSSLRQFIFIVPKLAEDPNPVMRMMVIIGMAMAGEDEKIKSFLPLITSFIKKGLEDEVDFVRGGSILALALLQQGHEYKEDFYRYLKEESDNVVGIAAASALVILKIMGKIKDPNLYKKLKKTPPRVRKGAAYGYWWTVKERRFIRSMNLAPKMQKQKELTMLKKALELSNNYPQARISLADIHNRRPRNKKKIRYHLEKALEASQDFNIIKDAADLYNQIGDRKKALKLYDQWIRLYPSDYRPYFFKGEIIGDRKKRNQNFRYALLALAKPSTTREYEHKIAILRHFGLAQQARDLLDKAVIENGSPSLYEKKIRLLSREKKYQEVLDIYDKYLKVRKSPSTAMERHRALSYIKVGKAGRALRVLRRVWRNPRHRNYTTTYLMALALEKMGHTNRAEKWYLYSQEQFRSGRAHAALAMFYQRQGKLPKAMIWLRKAPDDNYSPRITALIALNYALQKKKAKAVQYLEKAIQEGFSKRSWLEDQYGYHQAVQIEGFRSKLEVLESD